MAWKIKITNVEQNIAEITFTYQILDNASALKADGQQIIVNDPNDATASFVKGMMFEKAKKMESASDINAGWQVLIGQTFNVD